MTTTRLADMIVPQEFNDYVVQLTKDTSNFFQSGVMTDLTPVIDAQIEGKTVNMPFYNDLDTEAQEQVLDDTQDLVVDGLTTGQDVAVKLLRGKAFGGTDLAADLSGVDPVDIIATRFADWWNRRMQRALFSTLNGALGAANATGNVYDISGLTGAAANFDADSFVDANFLLAADLTAVAVHPDALKAMVKADMIESIQDSQTNLFIPTYMDKRVIVEKDMPVTGTGADKVYTTYIFGPGAVGYGERAPKVPVEVGREALRGMGQEYIVQRRQWVMHPRGIKWLGGTQSGPTPSNPELANTANWSRVYTNDNIRIVAFKHKIG